MKPLTPFVLILSTGIGLSLDQGSVQAQHAPHRGWGSVLE